MWFQLYWVIIIELLNYLILSNYVFFHTVLVILIVCTFKVWYEFHPLRCTFFYFTKKNIFLLTMGCFGRLWLWLCTFFVNLKSIICIETSHVTNFMNGKAYCRHPILRLANFFHWWNNDAKFLLTIAYFDRFWLWLALFFWWTFLRAIWYGLCLKLLRVIKMGYWRILGFILV